MTKEGRILGRDRDAKDVAKDTFFRKYELQGEIWPFDSPPPSIKRALNLRFTPLFVSKDNKVTDSTQRVSTALRPRDIFSGNVSGRSIKAKVGLFPTIFFCKSHTDHEVRA